MALFGKILKWFVGLAIVTSVALLFVFNWSFIFKKKVVGEVAKVESVTGGLAVITSNQQPLNPQVFSYSVAIKDLLTGEIHMASSEDRKWAAVQQGNCVVAAYFPYPPWRLSKGATDFNARLLQNFVNCESVPKDQDSFMDKLKFFFLWM